MDSTALTSISSHVQLYATRLNYLLPESHSGFPVPLHCLRSCLWRDMPLCISIPVLLCHILLVIKAGKKIAPQKDLPNNSLSTPWMNQSIRIIHPRAATHMDFNVDLYVRVINVLGFDLHGTHYAGYHSIEMSYIGAQPCAELGGCATACRSSIISVISTRLRGCRRDPRRHRLCTVQAHTYGIALALFQEFEQSPPISTAGAFRQRFVCQRCEYQAPMTENELVRRENTRLRIL